MNIKLDAKSLEWFHDELSVQEGNGVRFHVRYGGESTLHPGFSLGMSVEEPNNVAASVKQKDFLFFVREEDSWYFDGNDLNIIYNPNRDEIEFNINTAH